MDEDDKPERQPFVYRLLSHGQMEQLAQDIAAGKVFHSGMIREPHEILMVFMPLALLGDRLSLQEMQEQEVEVFYEYYDKAGPRSVNGMPCFFSVNMLNREQALIVQDKVVELVAIMDKRRKEAAHGQGGDAAADADAARTDDNGA